MTKKKSIGLVVAQPPIYTETFLMSKIQNLLDDGFEVTVFSNLKRENNTKARLYSSYTELSKWKLLYTFPVLLYKIIRHYRTILTYKKNITALYPSTLSQYKNIYSNLHMLFHPVDHLHFEFSVLAVSKEYIAKAMGAKMSVSFRGYDVSISLLKNPKSFQAVWECVDEVHTISDDLVKRALKHGMRSNTKVTKIEPAIDLSNFSAAQVRWGEVMHLTTTGRVSWKKGYQYVLGALQILKEQNIKFQYHIIGGFEAPEKEEFIYLCHRLHLEDVVVFHDKMGREDLNKLLDQTNIYIQYSVQEGFCNSAIEAQTKGLLTLVSDAGGLPENVIHKETGWVIEKRNPSLLAQKILEISKLSDADKHAISDRSRQHVSQRFDILHQQEQFRNFFNQAS